MIRSQQISGGNEHVECKKWPFRPVHLSNDGEFITSRPELNVLTGPGILPNSHMQGELTTLCSNIGHSGSIVEFAECEKRGVRTDAGRQVIRLNATSTVVVIQGLSQPTPALSLANMVIVWWVYSSVASCA
ncbi:MAG: hypothetical protein NT018_08780 [Armatimonadetes bacterium]|nr:hypothetical protein [Armatimonadota bacterium]